MQPPFVEPTAIHGGEACLMMGAIRRHQLSHSEAFGGEACLR
jgi:hypothetical protein